MEIGLISTGGAFIVHDKDTANPDSIEHLGLAYLAAALRQDGFLVSIINVESDEELTLYIHQQHPQLVGFVTTSATMYRVMELARTVKRIAPEIQISFGGHMATFCPDRLLQACPEVDFLVRGEGEHILLELCHAIASGANSGMDTRLASIMGISYRLGNHVFHNPPRPLIADLDTLPNPARDYLTKYSRLPFARISTSRGCYGHCSFCSSFVGRDLSPVWRGRSVPHIVDELEQLARNYKIQTFDIVDASFEDPPATGKKRLMEFADEVLQRNLNLYFNCNFRAESWTQEDLPLLERLEQAGLEKIFIGIESGVEKNLRLFGKRAKVEHNIRSIQLFSGRKTLNVTFGYIMFHPYNDFEELVESADFLHQTGISYDFRNYVTKLEVYPETRMYARMKQDGLVEEKDDFSECYSYSFRNPEVQEFALQMHGLLQSQEIFAYIDFDMRVYSFLSRVYRFAEELTTDELNGVDDFYDALVSFRRELSDFNYRFFIERLRMYQETGSIREQDAVVELGAFLNHGMIEMRSRQLRLMRKLQRVLRLMGYIGQPEQVGV